MLLNFTKLYVLNDSIISQKSIFIYRSKFERTLSLNLLPRGKSYLENEIKPCSGIWFYLVRIYTKKT